MADYAQKRIAPQNILGPSAGAGRFVESLQKFDAPITLIELEEEKTITIRKCYGNFCNIFCCDFLKYSMECKENYDLVIGNPPYISKKTLSEGQRGIERNHSPG